MRLCSPLIDPRLTHPKSPDIEDITSKTGNFKKFPVFVRMLLSGLQQGSDSVFVDLLTYADLEMLKARRERAGAGGPGGGGRPALPPNNKRYLILTYAAEFDRVHFPLPLLYEDAPDPAGLKATIAELRAALEEAAGGAGAGDGTAAELRRLRAENAALRDRAAANGGSDFGPEVQRLTSVAREAERELRLVRVRPCRRGQGPAGWVGGLGGALMEQCGMGSNPTCLVRSCLLCFWLRRRCARRERVCWSAPRRQRWRWRRSAPRIARSHGAKIGRAHV